MLTALMFIGIGVVVGIVGLLAYVYIDDWLSTNQLQARQRVQQEQREAEHRLQQITQDAMQEMLNIARRLL